MVLGRVGAFRRLTLVLLFDMCVQCRVTQVAFTAATDEGTADVVILGSSLIAGLPLVSVAALNVIVFTFVVVRALTHAAVVHPI